LLHAAHCHASVVRGVSLLRGDVALAPVSPARCPLTLLRLLKYLSSLRPKRAGFLGLRCS